MSQYPFSVPPYSPPIVDPRMLAMSQPNAAGKAAALWQLILGALIFLAGTCLISAVWIVPDDLISQAINQQHTTLPPVQNMSPVQLMRLAMSVASGLMLLGGGTLLILVFFVRRGGKVSSILSIVLTGIISLILLMNFVTGLTQVVGRPEAIIPLALFAGILALCAVTIAKLVLAVRAAGPAQMAAMQQAYYWMMQNQQAGGYGYGQTGYGYGAATGYPTGAPGAPPAPGGYPPSMPQQSAPLTPPPPPNENA